MVDYLNLFENGAIRKKFRYRHSKIYIRLISLSVDSSA
jgi:hypothetical protein